MPFWQFFRMGWDGHALLVRPSKMHHSIWKILFVLGAYEYLERQEGKIRKCLFFYVKILWNNSVTTNCHSRIEINQNHLFQTPFYLVKIIAHCVHLFTKGRISINADCELLKYTFLQIVLQKILLQYLPWIFHLYLGWR